MDMTIFIEGLNLGQVFNMARQSIVNVFWTWLIFFFIVVSTENSASYKHIEQNSQCMFRAILESIV